MANLKIAKKTIRYDGLGQIVAQVKNVDGEWTERMIVRGRQEAGVIRNLVHSQDDEVLIDIAAYRLFEIRDEKTGEVMFGHPQGKKAWFEFLPPPYFGVWVKREAKNE